MVKLICKLTFSDGQEVIGALEAFQPCTPCPIVYTGALDRLERRYDSGTASDLELLFTLLSRKTDAKLELKRSGDYERSPAGG